MDDFPKKVEIHEEGPREGFQISRDRIPTSRKVEFIEALATTGVKRIDCVAFVDPRLVPGMIDADEVTQQIRKRPGVSYTGLWLNTRGLERAMSLPVDLIGSIRITASETFSVRNTNRTIAQTIAEQEAWLRIYKSHQIPIEWGYVMTAFGCNFEGPVPISQVMKMIGELLGLAERAEVTLKGIYLADTVGHATPLSIARVVGAIRSRWPELKLGVHLHDTRGTGIANAYEALRLGVDHFDASCAGLGGCPFAGHVGAAGNICTEDFVYMCHEMGIETGIDLDALVECANLAEAIVGRQLPGKISRSGIARPR
ncbi:hydroxymethylglutaryl-CoA lyase [Achromobacter spanius]|uniref:hydroxymethylglutaryl-CoA lyase n=1 Tax=Achromobacter spanius TaxID=217203 RepID=UPI0036ED9B43